ncbi:MAG TPA: DJ-1/PfpI family protein, partial [Vicinamibacteria bacterium]
MRDRRVASRRAFVGLGVPALAALGLSHELGEAPASSSSALRPPAQGPIDVAFLISNGATVIDFTGPWEVFQDVSVPGRDDSFRLFTVADGRDPVRVTGGMQIVPDFSVGDAPPPHVVVVPAMRRSPAVLDWLRKVSARADLIMSVCTGAFVLGQAGLLAGKRATTHHDFHDRFAAQFPDVTLERGLRFVESAPNLATAGGLTSGIDLALRVVERYFGRDVAQRTAAYMEYQG